MPGEVDIASPTWPTCTSHDVPLGLQRAVNEQVTATGPRTRGRFRCLDPERCTWRAGATRSPRLLGERRHPPDEIQLRPSEVHRPLAPHGSTPPTDWDEREWNAFPRHHLPRRIDVVEIDIVGTPKRKMADMAHDDQARRHHQGRPATDHDARTRGRVARGSSGGKSATSPKNSPRARGPIELLEVHLRRPVATEGQSWLATLSSTPEVRVAEVARSNTTSPARRRAVDHRRRLQRGCRSATAGRRGRGLVDVLAEFGVREPTGAGARCGPDSTTC
jgi:hypothetical protein